MKKNIIIIVIVALLFGIEVYAAISYQANEIDYKGRRLDLVLDDLYTSVNEVEQSTNTNYLKEVTGIVNSDWKALYYCKNGKGTMVGCIYQGTLCDGGYTGGKQGDLRGCINSEVNGWPYYACSTTLANNDVAGAGLGSEEIDC